MKRSHRFGTDMRADRRSFWWLAMLLILIAVPLSAPGALPASAQGLSPVEWTRLDVDMDVGADGVIHVTETQEITFNGGPYRNGFAELPLARLDDITNVTVSEIDERGREVDYDQVSRADSTTPETYSARYNGQTLEVDYHFEPARNESRTFILEYDMVGAIRVYRDLDPPNQQIWRTVIAGDTTEVAPVLASTVTLTLPEAVDLNQVQIQNADGELADAADYSDDGQTFTWEARNLEDGEELEVRIQFPAIIDVDAPAWQQADDDRREAAEKDAERKDVFNLIFLAIAALGTIVGGIGLYALWYSRGRDPQVGLIADFLPTPPDDLPPGGAGALLDEQANERDIVATIVDLGRRGVFQIEDVTSAMGPDMRLTVKDPAVPMSDFEQALVNDLFDNDLTVDKNVTISQGVLSNPDRVKDALYAEIVKRGYYDRSPKATRESFKSVGRFLLIVGIAGVFIAPAVFDVGTAAIPFIVLGILGFVLQRLSGGMPKRSLSGAEATAKWNAFKRYLEDIQKYEQLEESKAIFEKYLPFAIAFGIDRTWVQKFSRANVPQPSWFGPVIIPGGGSSRPYQGPRGRGGVWGIPNVGGSSRSDSGDGGGLDLPDFGGVQSWSNRSAQGIQSGSDSFVDMLNSAGRAFSGFGGSGRSGGGSRRSTGSFGSRGGGSRGFSGGGSRGGGSSSGRRGFS